MLRLIRAADLVQRNGRAFSFHCASQRVMAASSPGTLSKLPRRMACSVIRANQALHQVEPRCAGGREMELDARMGGQPLLYRRVFVGPIVVADQVQFPARAAARQRLEEGDERLVPMATKAARVDLAAGHLQRRKQTGGAVTNVVVGAP